MKLLRVGDKGKEKPAVLDSNRKIRDLSYHIKDLNPTYLNFETISKINNLNLENLPGLFMQAPILIELFISGNFVKSKFFNLEIVSKFK